MAKHPVGLSVGIVIPLVLVGIVAAQGATIPRYTFGSGGLATGGSVMINASVGQALGGITYVGAVVLDVGFLVGAETQQKVYLPVVRR